MWTYRGARAGVLLGTMAVLLATTVVGAVTPGVLPAAAQDGQVEGLAEDFEILASTGTCP